MKKLILFFALSATIIFSTVGGFTAGFIGSRITNNSIAGGVGAIINQDLRITNQQEATIDVVNKASNSVVSIVVSQNLSEVRELRRNPFFNFFNEEEGNSESNELTQVASGTGFIVSTDGLIITNRHVVDNDSASYTVIFKDDTEYTAKVLAKDTLLDIAFLQIDAKNLTPLAFADSSKIQVGQSVVAIGNALGEFNNSVSAGIVSGLGRNIVASDSFGNNLEQIYNVIQTDASINSGNSGGPLLDLNGNVIGVNVAVASNAQGIGFAIPSNSVKDLLERLNSNGNINRPKLGVRFIMITESLRKANNLSVENGALIQRGESINDLAVIPLSPADKAGIKENDIIIKVNNTVLDINNPLNVVIQQYKINDVVELTILRQGKEIKLNVTLE